MKKVIQIEDVEAHRFWGAYESICEKIENLQKNFQPKDPTEYVTKKEVAKMFDVSLVTISDWTKKDILKAYRIGNRVYYKRHEIEAALVQINSSNNDAE